MLALWLAATLSAAPGLDGARQLFEQLKYPEAAKALAKVRSSPDLSHEDLLETLWLQGLCSVSMGNAEEARGPWRTLAYLDPSRQVPDLPPKLLTVWYESRGWAASQPQLVFDGHVLADGKLELSVKADPLKLVAGARIHRAPATGEPKVAKVSAPPQQLPLEGAIGWWAELLGANGEVLAQLGSAAAPRPGQPEVAVTAPPPPPAPETPSEHRPRLIPLVFGGVALVGAGAGIGLGVASNNAQASFDNATRLGDGTISGLTQRKAYELQSTHQTDAIIANVCFGLAAAAATAALLYFFLGPKELW